MAAAAFDERCSPWIQVPEPTGCAITARLKSPPQPHAIMSRRHVRTTWLWPVSKFCEGINIVGCLTGAIHCLVRFQHLIIQVRNHEF